MMSLPSMQDLSPGDLISSSAKLTSERTVYKWKDSDNVWHYGDQPPEGSQFSTLVVNDQTNIIQSTPVPEKEPPTSIAQSTPDKKTYTPPKSSEDALTLDKALNIVDDAHAVRDMMEQRNQQLDAIAGNKQKK